jgi:hypothetical protein
MTSITVTDYSVFASSAMILEGVWINTVEIVFSDGEGDPHRSIRVVRTPIFSKDGAEEMRLDLEKRTLAQLKDGWFTVGELLDDLYGDWREIPLHT